MITLITGLPGNGKTLYALDWLRKRAEKEGRPVYYDGIKDLKLPWIEHDFEKWYELPANAIIVCDEVQRKMRPRQHGTTVPRHVTELETHRHKGVDIVLITQDAMLLDSNARRLVGQHFHVVRKFGTKSATVHEWGAVKEGAAKNRDDSIRHAFPYPKDVFNLYHSAEVHTHKMRIPPKVWGFLALPFILAVIGWFFWSKVSNWGKPKDAPQGQQVMAHSGQLGSAAGAGAKLTPAQYTAQYEARVKGLAYTAPAYDEVTKPTEAPYPAACVSSKTRCQCYTQQGTRLPTDETLCRGIADGGFFVAWKQPLAQAVPVNPQVQPANAVAAVPPAFPGAISLGGDPRSHIRPDADSGSTIAPDETRQPGRGRNLPPPKV